MLRFIAFISGKIKWRYLDVLHGAGSLIRTVICNHGTIAEQNNLIQNWALCNFAVDCHVLEQNNHTRSIRLRLSLTDSLRGKRTLKISRVSLVAVTM